MNRRRACLLLLLSLGAGTVAGEFAPALGQPVGLARESAVKAAFLYKFCSFVEYPAGAFRAPTDPFVIAVYGDDGVASELEQITTGRTIDGRTIKVRRIYDGDILGTVHLLYAGGPRQGRAREIAAAARGPVLTVTDSPGSGSTGPVLYFSLEDGRVRFSASLTAAAARNLRLSSRLLTVALQVEGR